MKSDSFVPFFFVINIVLINPFAEFWLLTVAHNSVLKMNTHIAGSSAQREEAEKELKGCVSQQEMRLVLFFWLYTIESTKESL